MDPNSLATSSTTVRKVRFKPKAPPKDQKPVLFPKVEKVEEDAEAANREALESLFDQQGYVRPKIERKEEPKVPTFGAPGSTYLKSYRHPNVKPDPGATGKNGLNKEYKEPWNYCSYYPVTLPLRMPHSGDPELLDELEFGNGSESQKYDEDSINAAEQLGLTVGDEDDTEPGYLFLQLPSKLPMPKGQPGKDTDVNGTAMPKEHPGKDTAVNGTASNKISSSKNRGALDELPPGYMGKLVVHKSGVVKLKLGDNLYDVASGVDSTFAQDVVSVHKEQKRCCAVRDLRKRAIITPDLDSLFNNKLDL